MHRLVGVRLFLQKQNEKKWCKEMPTGEKKEIGTDMKELIRK
jgi:hypothetical protein